MACDDIAEVRDGAAAAPLAEDVARTMAAARRVIELIEAVVRFNLTAHAPPPQAEAVRDMLARLPGEVARTVPAPTPPHRAGCSSWTTTSSAAT